MSLRVLQLGPYPPPEGGISRNMLAIREELLARGHECVIVATSRSSRIDNEADVHHPRSPYAFLRTLSKLKFDVLHLHVGGDIGRRVLALAAACSFFGRRACVLTVHSGKYPQTEDAKTASANSLRGWIFRRFTRLIAVNEEIADVFRRYGVSDDRIKVILPYALRPPDDNVRVPAELSDFYAEHSPVLISVGGLEEEYDPLMPIAAMQEIRNDLPNAGLMIVGDGSMRKRVEVAVADSDHRSNICLAGNIEHAVTLHLINDADVLLRTTLYDGDAISVREALFLGTPVIATDTNSRPPGVTLINIGDREGLVSQIKEVASNNKVQRPTLRSDQANIREIVDLYEGLIRV